MTFTQERANREIKRRSRVVQVFPSEKSLERLVGAVMCEQDEAWSQSRYFSYDKIQELYDEKRAAAPAATGKPDGELAEEARKMILASPSLLRNERSCSFIGAPIGICSLQKPIIHNYLNYSSFLSICCEAVDIWVVLAHNKSCYFVLFRVVFGYY